MAARQSKITRVEKAVREARRIRCNLLRSKYTDWRSNDLAGACGLASILLSIAMNDVDILRHRRDHVWTEIDGVIVDITATQFNLCEEDPDVKGVLITKTPRPYHTDTLGNGLSTYLWVVNGNWYDKRDHTRWSWISEYWL